MHWLRLVGIPDYFGCVCGHFIALEFKRDGKSQPREMQRLILAKIARAGGYIAVVEPANFSVIYKELNRFASFAGVGQKAAPDLTGRTLAYLKSYDDHLSLKRKS